MKTKFIFVFALALPLGGCRTEGGPGSPNHRSEAQDGGDGQRLVSLVDYVAADYGGAVSNGEVVSAFEYEEQLGFLETASALAGAVADPLSRATIGARVNALRDAVRRKADPSVVASLGRAAREDIVSTLGLLTTPRGRPSLNRAESLYLLSCAACHGADGLGQTEVAAALEPRPTSFKNQDRRAALSPYRVFNALTLGVPGTAMPAFDGLSPAERWDLAFFVLRVAHEGELALGPVSMTLADLSVRSDGDVLESLTADGHPSPEQGLAFARREAAFAEAPLGLGIEQIRAMVRTAAGLGVAGRTREADRVILDAYLQGFEPLEAQISARDPNRTQSVEIAFRDFRAALVNQNPANIQKEALVLDELISRSGSQNGTTIPFVAAFIIYFREGIEAALLVGALLGGVRKLGRRDAIRAIHLGWAGALLAGGLSWFLFSRLIAIAPAQRELIEAVIGLLAAVILFSVSCWMISKAESRKWMAFLKDQLNRGLSSGRVWSFAGVAFLAVYRECAETILFTEALLIEAVGNAWPVVAGAASGLTCVVLIAIAVQNAFRLLPMPVFFGVSGFLLSLLAIAFAGSSVSAFVAAGYVQPHPIPFPSIPMLGIHPDLSSLAVQSALVLLLTGTGLKTYMDSRVPDKA
ncbi:MAG: FTR1 family protein [Vicinamibacteria bacterium]|nr:FTR1 family protein [Vicinamibacteria bacterium]